FPNENSRLEWPHSYLLRPPKGFKGFYAVNAIDRIFFACRFAPNRYSNTDTKESALFALFIPGK
ncbi:MAG: hypothetical protein QX203_15635, partial [Methylococcaceae bacterium]